MKIASLFSGAGGLDLGFEKAGFDVVWANEYDKAIWATYERNFPDTFLDKRSIVKVSAKDVPDVDGIIGGPPCQSWSEAGARRGIKDDRGQLFFNYITLLRKKRPKFFLAENVSGILLPRHSAAFQSILSEFADAGYDVSFKLLNANDYGVPQERWRVIIVGIRSDLGLEFSFPEPVAKKPTLKDAIKDLSGARPAANGTRTHGDRLKVANHEYMTGGFSTIYMSRNRVRGWDEPSFTIQAGARHAPLHPKAPKMLLVGKDERIFVPGKEQLYRRLSVRECARVQTFPDNHVFEYSSVVDGYKMVGNAVPVNFAFHLAKAVKACLSSGKSKSSSKRRGQKRQLARAA